MQTEQCREHVNVSSSALKLSGTFCQYQPLVTEFGSRQSPRFHLRQGQPACPHSSQALVVFVPVTEANFSFNSQFQALDFYQDCCTQLLSGKRVNPKQTHLPDSGQKMRPGISAVSCEKLSAEGDTSTERREKGPEAQAPLCSLGPSCVSPWAFILGPLSQCLGLHMGRCAGG